MPDDLSPAKALVNLLTESEAYTSMELIETYIEKGVGLGSLPVQPLYLAIKSLPPEKVTSCLPMFSKEQRKAFLDLDLWFKDDIDINHFSSWLEIYARSPEDEIRQEFCQSEEFLLFLKSRLNIWTFDVDDPMYPDHDYYFLTEDTLLLVEYDETFDYVDETKNLIKDLYAELGVEQAYAFLFKMISDNFMSFQEDQYQVKRESLRELGFVDYYDSLEIENCFPSLSHLHYFIKSKGVNTGEIDTTSRQQALHKNSIISYKSTIESFSKELAKVEDNKRVHYLNFNFIRLVNGMLSFNNALKEGPVSMTRVGQRVRCSVELGFNYVKNFSETEGLITSVFKDDQTLLDRFDFVDFYKVGNSLISFTKKNIKKALGNSELEDENETFVGSLWLSFLDNSFSLPVKFQDLLTSTDESEKAVIITDPQILKSWTNTSAILVQLLPFIKQFKNSFDSLLTSGRLQDSYYLNYNVVDIDFESIILSSFANFYNGAYEGENANAAKMGLTIDEFLAFTSSVFKEKTLNESQSLNEKISAYIEKFGMSSILNFDLYLKALMRRELEGYDFSDLDATEFKHVGGPIILNAL